jgi:hypothetical protein
MGARHYQELIVWQKAMDLVVMVYRATAGFPREEMFGLTMQVRKAAVSIPSNIERVKDVKQRAISCTSLPLRVVRSRRLKPNFSLPSASLTLPPTGLRL